MISEYLEDIISSKERIPAALEAVDTILNLPFVWFCIGIFALWLFRGTNLAWVKDVVAHVSSRKIKNIDVLHGLRDKIPNSLSTVYEDAFEKELFAYLTGVSVEKMQFRDALIKLYLDSGSDIGWPNIRRAKSYLSFDSEGLIVKKMQKFDLVCYYLNMIFAIFLFSAFLMLLIIFALTVGSNIKMVALLVMAIAVLFIAGFVASQNWPIQDAKRIGQFLAQKS